MSCSKVFNTLDLTFLFHMMSIFLQIQLSFLYKYSVGCISKSPLISVLILSVFVTPMTPFRHSPAQPVLYLSVFHSTTMTYIIQMSKKVYKISFYWIPLAVFLFVSCLFMKILSIEYHSFNIFFKFFILLLFPTMLFHLLPSFRYWKALTFSVIVASISIFISFLVTLIINTLVLLSILIAFSFNTAFHMYKLSWNSFLLKAIRITSTKWCPLTPFLFKWPTFNLVFLP